MMPRLVAHRGDMARFPENSLSGILAALKAGACFVEFDVQMNRNGRFLVVHDDNLRRVSGVIISVLDADMDRLRAVPIGQPDRFGSAWRHERLVELPRVLERFQAWPKATAVIEIKQESLDRWGLAPVMDNLLAEIVPWMGQCGLISFNAEALVYARMYVEIPVGWVLTRFDAESLHAARRLSPEVLICNYRKLPPGEPPPAGPWEWMLYDILEPRAALDWGALGVALIETGDISRMLKDERLAGQSCKDNP
ncbi:MAG TPA: hypothetical protein ENK26_04750 [Gammaproteobacteria bacterium]|nr:hypothetical protein [Gammaproteobacteria bacterium]